MKSAEQHCLEFVLDYVKNHWDNINYNKIDITDSKETFIKDVQQDFYLVTWFITEALDWGLIEEIGNLIVNDEPLVYHLNGKDIKFTLVDDYNWKVNYSKKVPKTVYVYE